MAALNEAGIYEEDFVLVGADLGDIAKATLATELAGCTLSAYIPSQNVVRVQLVNNTARTISLGTSQLEISVYK